MFEGAFSGCRVNLQGGMPLIGVECYQRSNSIAFALVFFDSIIVGMLLKLGAEGRSGDVEFAGRDTFTIKGVCT